MTKKKVGNVRAIKSTKGRKKIGTIKAKPAKKLKRTYRSIPV